MTIEHVLNSFQQFKKQHYFLFVISDELSLQRVTTRPHLVYTDNKRRQQHKSISLYPHQYGVHSPTTTDAAQLAITIESVKPRPNDRPAEQYTALHIANKLLNNKLNNIHNDAKLKLTSDAIDLLRSEKENYELIKTSVTHKLADVRPEYNSLKQNSFSLWNHQQANPYQELDEQLTDFIYSWN